MPQQPTALQFQIRGMDCAEEVAILKLEGEAAGESSRFVGQNESLGKVQEFAGSITGEVEGTPYAGDFKEEAGHHDEKAK